LAAIGYGLMSMLKPTTSSSKWIGYQVLYGVGSGAMTSAVSLLPNILSPSLHPESDFANFAFA
jgi:hypothetical protein